MISNVEEDGNGDYNSSYNVNWVLTKDQALF